MNRFFEHIIQPRAPRGPLEGALKLLLYSQFITVPITLSIDEYNLEQIAAVSGPINGIHLASIIVGLVWGLLNRQLEPPVRPEPQHNF